MKSKSRYYLLFIFTFVFTLTQAQTIYHREITPQDFYEPEKNHLTTSSLYYKEGNTSLEWDFTPGSVLTFKTQTPFVLNNDKENKYGITLWIYNETKRQDSVRFEFLSPQGEISYWFSFRLAAVGWRACWISFQHMRGDKQNKEIANFRLVAPQQKGRIFLDRLTFPVKEMNGRVTPDRQMPYNNSLPDRDLWHWCRLWEWEQSQYDTPVPSFLTPQEKKDLQTVEQRLHQELNKKDVPTETIAQAYRLFEKAHIRQSGSGFVGAPLLSIDEMNRKQGDLGLEDLNTMLAGLAYDVYYNHSKQSEANYFLVWEYAINQGFAYGSGMGTSRHYGYKTRDIYTTAWLMREAIWRYKNRDAILATLLYWSSLAETRKPFQYGRREIMDNWHTLTMTKIISALMYPDIKKRVRALKSLSRWTSASLQYSPGTIGGIKEDGTTFHHDGFYPAYTCGVLAMLGRYVNLTTGTQFQLTESARQNLKSAFIAMRNYCNIYEWGIGLGGRHPFGGAMGKEDVAAFAYLALSGELSSEGNSFDRQLAADYLRLCPEDTPEARYFKSQGVQKNPAPQGFFTYNYGAAGIFRQKDWMVTLKGYNNHVWGAEIYAKDNRYGRYQSYGSVQIMGQSSRMASGYDENGWDWNRLPGTTTIHLPLTLLDSPLAGTTMERSQEKFAGSSHLEGKNGMFAMKLKESGLKNFTPDFVARKSVFCFENRMICLGTGISNSNDSYPTETTLFQSVFAKGTTDIFIDGKRRNQVFVQQLHDQEWHRLQDGYDNHYFVKGENLHIQIAHQKSRHDKTREETHGTFASAWLSHGQSPQNAEYEYMVLIQPDSDELAAARHRRSYQVRKKDNTAHIVFDEHTGITAYAVFETCTPPSDELFARIPAETMVMRRYRNGNEVLISVCDPNLHLLTAEEKSQPHEKTLLLAGKWVLSAPNPQIRLLYDGGKTRLTVTCQYGLPVEMTLRKNK